MGKMTKADYEAIAARRKIYDSLPEATIDIQNAAFAEARSFIETTSLYSSSKDVAILAIVDFLLSKQGVKAIRR